MMTLSGLYRALPSSHLRLMATALVMLALTGAAACGGDGQDEEVARGGDTPTLAAAEATPTPTPSPEPSPTPSEVRKLTVSALDQLVFDPAEIQARVGETIKFEVINDGQLFHTFTIALTTSKDEILVDLPLEEGEVKSAEITIPEDVQSLYLFCKPHESAGMTGTIHVGGGG